MMGSSTDAVIAYELARLRGMGYSVTVSPAHGLPTDGQLGTDVLVGTLTSDVEGVLATEGAMVRVAPGEGITVALRRRIFCCPKGLLPRLHLADAVRLHPYVARIKQEDKG